MQISLAKCHTICLAAAAAAFCLTGPVRAETNTRGPGYAMDEKSLASHIAAQATRIWFEFSSNSCTDKLSQFPKNVTFVGLPEGDYRVSEPIRQRINALLLQNIDGGRIRPVPLDYLGSLAQFLPNDRQGMTTLEEARNDIEKHPLFAQATSSLRSPEVLHIQVKLWDRRPGCAAERPIDVAIDLIEFRRSSANSFGTSDHFELDGFFRKALEGVAAEFAKVEKVESAELRSEVLLAGACIFRDEVATRFKSQYLALGSRLSSIIEARKLPPLADSRFLADDERKSATAGSSRATLLQTYSFRQIEEGTLTAKLELHMDGLLRHTFQYAVVVPRSELEGCSRKAPEAEAKSDPAAPPSEAIAPPAEPRSQQPLAPPAKEYAQPPVAPVISCGKCPEMIRIVPDEAPSRAKAGTRGPKSDMRVSRPAFHVSRDEVTVGEFRSFTEASGHVPSASTGEKDTGCYAPTEGDNTWVQSSDRTPFKPGFAQGPDHPVVCVSWHDAVAYVRWLSSISGHSFRLLSESEHEFVARAGIRTSYWWGETADPAKANYELGPGRSSLGVRGTVAGNALSANPWGLRHVLGNVAEWVEDCWIDTIDASSGLPGKARLDGDCARRVIRGGGWTYRAEDITATARDNTYAHRTYVDVGFRVAADE